MYLKSLVCSRLLHCCCLIIVNTGISTIAEVSALVMLMFDDYVHIMFSVLEACVVLVYIVIFPSVLFLSIAVVSCHWHSCQLSHYSHQLTHLSLIIQERRRGRGSIGGKCGYYNVYMPASLLCFVWLV